MDKLIFDLIVAGGLATGILLATHKFSTQLGPLNYWLIDRAIQRLPQAHRERLGEEWLAHLNELESKHAKLWHALGCLLSTNDTEFIAKLKTQPPSVEVGAPVLHLSGAPVVHIIAHSLGKIVLTSYHVLSATEENITLPKVVFLNSCRSQQPQLTQRNA
jgi:hypothetical protein